MLFTILVHKPLQRGIWYTPCIVYIHGGSHFATAGYLLSTLDTLGSQLCYSGVFASMRIHYGLGSLSVLSSVDRYSGVFGCTQG